MGENGQFFLLEEIQLINVEGMKEIKKSPWEHHGNDYSMQDLQMDAKVNVQNLKEKEYICIISEYFLQHKC